MKFRVDSSFFEKVDNACFGVLVVKNIDNSQEYPFIKDLLKESCHNVATEFENIKVKEDERIVCYREAFRQVNINPNKFMCSIEALVSRIAKSKEIPSINPVVDLTNAYSLKYLIPLGAHNIDEFDGDIEFRLGNETDIFVPIGQDISAREEIGLDEYVYVSGADVKTRRWAWRQGDRGKIVKETRNVFIPIDGFTNINKESVLKVRDELANVFQEKLNADVCLGFVDKDNLEFEF